MLLAPLLIAVAYPLFWLLERTPSLSEAESTLVLLWVSCAILVALVLVLEESKGNERKAEEHIRKLEESRDDFMARWVEERERRK